MTWVTSGDSAAVNLDRVAVLGVRNTGEDEYQIGVFASEDDVAGDALLYLTGTWATLADAQTVLTRLVNAVDPSAYAS